MLAINKKMIDTAFRAFLIKISCCYGISLPDMTLVVRIVEKGKMLAQLCRKDIPQTSLDIGSMLPEEMIGLRFDANCIKKIFLAVHYAFMQELKQTDPLKISLILYESAVAGCACMGIMQNEMPVKVLMVSDVLQAMELGSDQLN